MKSEDI